MVVNIAVLQLYDHKIHYPMYIEFCQSTAKHILYLSDNMYMINEAYLYPVLTSQPYKKLHLFFFFNFFPTQFCMCLSMYQLVNIKQLP